MAEKIPGWLGRVLLPEITEMKGGIKALETEMKGEIRALETEMKGEIRALDAKVDGEFKSVRSDIRRVEEKLMTKIDELDKRLDVAQRLAVVEEQLKEARSRS